jgi:DNA-binding transcriptional LysR family regulator
VVKQSGRPPRGKRAASARPARPQSGAQQKGAKKQAPKKQPAAQPETPPVDLTPRTFRLGAVPGATPGRWIDTWQERMPHVTLKLVPISVATQRDELAGVDAALVRTPIARADGLHVIPLYDEVTVAWVSKDHPVAAYDEVTLADLADETLLTDLDAVAIDRVNAGAVLLVPMSVARSASRRDLVHRPVTDAEPTSISLAWRTDNEHPLIDEFIGIVRGRTANSSRTQAERAASTPKPKPQRLSSPGKRPGNAPRPPKVRKKRR